MNRHSDFFEQENCDRCRGSLKVRTMSWFNQDVICGTCSVWEEVIIDRRKEDKDKLESTGQVPNVDCEIRWGAEVPEQLKPM